MAGWEFAPMTWEAAAGFSAVIGATVVGLKAAGIARGQRDIQARQVHLEELKRRSDLFDKRFEVYRDVRKFLAEIMTQGAPPEPATEQVFLSAVERSRFLFRARVHDDLNEVWRKANSYRAAYKAAKVAQDHIDAEDKHFRWLVDRGLSLHEVFDELHLTVDPPVE